MEQMLIHYKKKVFKKSTCGSGFTENDDNK